MIEGMESYLGRKLKPEYIEKYMSHIIHGCGYIVTRPDNCGPMTHINMNTHFDSNFRIVDFSGSKCYSHYSGLYNRSAKIRTGHFTAKDIAYWRRFIKEITIES